MVEEHKACNPAEDGSELASSITPLEGDVAQPSQVQIETSDRNDDAVKKGWEEFLKGTSLKSNLRDNESKYTFEWIEKQVIEQLSNGLGAKAAARNLMALFASARREAQDEGNVDSDALYKLLLKGLTELETAKEKVA